MIRKINPFDYSEFIVKQLPKGALLNTNGDKFNSMVVGWGHLGVVWSKPVFVVYVRENRYTKKQLDLTREFTLSFPLADADPKIFKVCGASSGRDVDKVAEAGLELALPQTINTPGVKQYPLTLECKVLYAQRQDLELLPKEIRDAMYPTEVDGTAFGANRDPHTAYYGEIVDAYVVE